MASAADIPESDFTNPFGEGTYLHNLYGKIHNANRDLVIVVSDKRGRRGTGKTVASLRLANMMDQTPEGLTFDKCSLSPQQLRNAYSLQPNTSGLVLDEAEVGAGNRDAMTVTNKALREVMSMARVEEKYLVVNAPLKGFIDTDILKLADAWIAMEKRGQGLVHQLKWEPYSETLLREQKQRIKLNDIPKGTDLRDVYNKLTREKQKRISGEEGEKFITKQEVDERLQKARKEARKQMRDEIVKGVYQHPSIESTQGDIGDAIGVSQKTVSNIVRDET